MLSPGFIKIAEELDISVSKLAKTTGYMILTMGLSLLLISPFAKIYGRRPIYIFAIIMLVISSIIGGAAKNFHDFQSSRIIGAFGLAPFEFLVQSTIGDLYFVHERATRIAFWNLCLLCGINAGSVIAGYVIQNLSWQWCFWFCSIFYGVLMFLIIFLVPETCFNREKSVVVRPMAEAVKNHETKDGSTMAVMHLETQHHRIRDASNNDVEQMTTNSPNNVNPPRMSYRRSLSVYSGRYSNASMLKVIVRPAILFWYPAVFCLFIIFGVMLTFSVLYSNIIGVVFVAPPYNFSTSQAGLTGISPLVMVLIGEIVSGPLNDSICLYLTRRNKGIYEPEFRLVLMLVVVILGTVGLFGFGATIHYQTHWSGPVLTYGLFNMALAFASTCLFGYVLDCYPELSSEAFVALNMRNILAFGISYVIEDWLASSGALKVFETVGGVFLGTCAFAVPLWIFGKKVRRYIARNEWLTKFMSDYD